MAQLTLLKTCRENIVTELTLLSVIDTEIKELFSFFFFDIH